MAAVVMLPILLLAGMAHASVLYRCRMDGQARKACCCPPKAHDTHEPTGPVMSRGSCCDTETTSRAVQQPSSTATEAREGALLAVAPIDVPIAVAVPPLRTRAIEARALEPPPTRPPLILLKSSRLI